MTRRAPRTTGLVSSDLSGLPIETIEGHALERDDNVRTTLALLYPLRQLGWLPAAAVTIAGAHWQKTRGRRIENTEAAHTMPRRLLIGGRPLHDWLTGRDDLLLAAIASLEGTVTTLPAAVNRPDSAWEQAGLSMAFADAAERVLGAGAATVEQAETSARAIWTRFHQSAGTSLAAARDAEHRPDCREVLDTYARLHRDAEQKPPGHIAYYWDLIS